MIWANFLPTHEFTLFFLDLPSMWDRSYRKCHNSTSTFNPSVYFQINFEVLNLIKWQLQETAETHEKREIADNEKGIKHFGGFISCKINWSLVFIWISYFFWFSMDDWIWHLVPKRYLFIVWHDTQRIGHDELTWRGGRREQKCFLIFKKIENIKFNLRSERVWIYFESLDPEKKISAIDYIFWWQK